MMNNRRSFVVDQLTASGITAEVRRAKVVAVSARTRIFGGILKPKPTQLLPAFSYAGAEHPPFRSRRYDLVSTDMFHGATGTRTGNALELPPPQPPPPTPFGLRMYKYRLALSEDHLRRGHKEDKETMTRTRTQQRHPHQAQRTVSTG